MPILDHTIVAARDNQQAAAFLATILGLPSPVTLGPFAVVQVGQTTTLDFVTVDGPVVSQHYAFLVTEAEFDEIFFRIREHRLKYWADPSREEADRINTWDGGRGVYFDDPNGHLLEIITRRYGTGGTTTDQPHPLVAATSADRSPAEGDTRGMASSEDAGHGHGQDSPRLLSSEGVGGNPIIRHVYTADPTAVVVDDTVYLYTGHDEAPPGTHEYVMHDWRCFSSSDLVTWMEHPVPLRAADFAWSNGRAYASKVIVNNGTYFWFVSVGDGTGPSNAIGVAVADDPAGPFRDYIGRPLVRHDDLPSVRDEKANLDPTVLIDGGTPLMWWGNGTCYFARLTDDLRGLAGPIGIVDLPGFEEGAHIHKRGGWYYLSYGYGSPERVAYAMSRSVEGPWEFSGILNEIPGNAETNRPCIIEFRDQSFFLYHNGALPGGGSHRRSVCIDRLHYNTDDTMQRVIMTSEGPGPIL